jgi:hypothetical protein
LSLYIGLAPFLIVIVIDDIEITFVVRALLVQHDGAAKPRRLPGAVDLERLAAATAGDLDAPDRMPPLGIRVIAQLGPRGNGRTM